MLNYQNSLIGKIDDMSWLELRAEPEPIEDIYQFMNYVSKWPLFVFMTSAALCMFFSAAFHLFYV